jgi:hypothetical protein
MNNFINSIINWSEVWSLFVPLFIIFRFRPKGPGVKPLIIYVLVALIINFIATIMVEYYFSMPSWLKNNNILYNLHSSIRVIFFSWYFMTIKPYGFPRILKMLLVSYLVFAAVNFVFFQSPFFISNYHFTAESIMLLLLCLSFFFRSMQDESTMNWLKHPAFLVCTGISLYEATSFFIFLFFYPLVKKDLEFADLTMSIHNVMYIILCIILAIALYRYRKRPESGTP